jgi:histidine decarboxylase
LFFSKAVFSVENGGSGSNLFALQTGRDRFIGSGKPLHVLCTKATHYSNYAALHTLMMENVEEVAMLEGDAMDMTDLRKRLKALPSQANVVLILTSGTTMRGGNDNLRLAGAALMDAGFTADRFHVHVDAALMGPYLLFATGVPSEIRPSFSNFPFINSICFSGHKALGTTGCCGVLVWNKST